MTEVETKKKFQLKVKTLYNLTDKSFDYTGTCLLKHDNTSYLCIGSHTLINMDLIDLPNIPIDNMLVKNPEDTNSLFEKINNPKEQVKTNLKYDFVKDIKPDTLNKTVDIMRGRVNDIGEHNPFGIQYYDARERAICMNALTMKAWKCITTLQKQADKSNDDVALSIRQVVLDIWKGLTCLKVSELYTGKLLFFTTSKQIIVSEPIKMLV